MPIMILEAQYLGISVIWSYETGEYVEPSIDEIEKRLIALEKHFLRNGKEE